MYDTINLGPVKVIYGGKKFGNMDFRFDSNARVSTRRKQLEQDFPGLLFVEIKASGGDTFVDLSKVEDLENWQTIPGDGIICDDQKTCITLFPADCIPLVIYSTKSNTRAIIHIGHNGAETGIHLKALRYLLDEKKQNLDDLRFFIGPSISKESYFFKEIHTSQKESEDWQPFISFEDGNYHIDLQGFVTAELCKYGVLQENIKDIGIDTFNTDYFSHRRGVITGENEGRNLFVMLPKIN
jgi:copper oxidase (laccase) domain-containing protein